MRAVEFTNLRGMNAQVASDDSSTTLYKCSTLDSGWNACASSVHSVQPLGAGGHGRTGVGFQPCANSFFALGLARGGDDAHRAALAVDAGYTSIDFAVICDGSDYRIFENGIEKKVYDTMFWPDAGTGYSGVEVKLNHESNITYCLNGHVFYTSLVQPRYPLHVKVCSRQAGPVAINVQWVGDLTEPRAHGDLLAEQQLTIIALAESRAETRGLVQRAAALAAERDELQSDRAAAEQRAGALAAEREELQSDRAAAERRAAALAAEREELQSDRAAAEQRAAALAAEREELQSDRAAAEQRAAALAAEREELRSDRAAAEWRAAALAAEREELQSQIARLEQRLAAEMRLGARGQQDSMVQVAELGPQVHEVLLQLQQVSSQTQQPHQEVTQERLCRPAGEPLAAQRCQPRAPEPEAAPRALQPAAPGGRAEGAAGCGPAGRRFVGIGCPGAAAVDVEVVDCQYRMKATFHCPRRFGASASSCVKEFAVSDGPFEVKAGESAIQHGLLTLALQPRSQKFHLPCGDSGGSATRPASGWAAGSAGEPAELDHGRLEWPATSSEHEQPEPSAADSASWSASGSGAASSEACASAPPQLEVPRCFLPQTRFLLPGGRQVTAAELRLGGGDVLQGPGAKTEIVRAACKHPARERDLVRVQTEGCCYPFVITADHLLEVEGPHGARVPVRTAELLGKRVFDGESFREVVGVERLRGSAEVVEVTFESDEAVVLAWLPPRRRPHSGPRELRPEALVACRGAALDANVRLRELNAEPSGAAPARRSLSAGARPRGPAWITRGCREHPQGCTPCRRHLGHLQDPAARPQCKYGRSCRHCHLPHGPEPASPEAAC